MEIRARYVLIGLFVLAVIVGGFGFVYWLQNSGGLTARTAYRVEFDGSISGLSAGSRVLFNGLDVGEVTGLSLVADHPDQVMATISIDAATPVRTDTHVGLVFAGLTGTATVALTGGTSGAAAPSAENGAPPLLVADPAAMKDMTEAARDVLGHLDSMVTDNADGVKKAIDNIATFSDALGKNADRIDGILKGLSKLTGGGSSDAQPITYDLTPPTDFPAIAALPSAQLAVTAPSAVISLDTPRILIEADGGDTPAFPDAHLADNIPVLIQAKLIQGFENAKYLKVGADGGDFQADDKLVLDLRSFRIATTPAPQAEIGFSAKLLDNDGKVIDAHMFAATAPVTATDNADVAAKGLDAAFGKAATDLIVWTLNAMNAAPAASPPADNPPDAPADQAPPPPSNQ